MAWEANVRLAALAFSFWDVDGGVRARVDGGAAVAGNDDASSAESFPGARGFILDAAADLFSSVDAATNMRDRLPLAPGEGVA